MEHSAPRLHSGRRRSALLSFALATLLLPLAAVVPAWGPAPAQASAAQEPELVTNGGFEDGIAAWRTNRKRQTLKATRPSVTGASSARLKVTVPGRTVLKNTRPSVSTADLDATYTLTAYVRSTGRVIPGRLRVREVTDGTVVKRHWKRFRAGDDWKQVRLQFAPSEAAALDVSVSGEKLGTHVALLVDDISMTSDRATSAPAPQDPTTQACISDPMGIPAPGTTLLGAAVGGTSDIDARESELGGTLPLHRTYYQGDQIDRAVRVAKEDLSLGRLPWISFKPPMSWEAMAAGQGDAWSRELADALATVPGPVWLAIHHEPEMDGDMQLWTEMQRRIAPIIHARTDNVAYSVIYGGWHTYAQGQDTVATKWPGDQHVDILAVDAYNPYGKYKNGKMITNSLDITTYYEKMAAWAEAHGTRGWAIGETGQTAASADVDPHWIARAYRDMRAMGGAGLNYFDSSRNSEADWTLDYRTKFDSYEQSWSESARVCQD